MTSPIVPLVRPKQERSEKILALLRSRGVRFQDVAVLGIRGYYQNSMGEHGENDYGIYDDALFIIADGDPDPRRKDLWVTFNANTDPKKQGMNPAIKKPYALLAPGLYSYRIGMHRSQYEALVQAAPVTVIRDAGDGTPPYNETGYFGINIHRGSFTSTSSEGCQTIHPSQWVEFIRTVKRAVLARFQPAVPYLLLTNTQYLAL